MPRITDARKAMLGGALVAMLPALTLANEARLDVSASPDDSAVETLEVEQTPGFNSYIGGADFADGSPPSALVPDASIGAVEGSWALVRIRQLNGSNALAINVQGSPDSTAAQIDLSYVGDRNEHVLRVGADSTHIAGQANPDRFRDASIVARVVGDGNDISDDILGGGSDGLLPADAAVLDYSLVVEGSENTVRTQYGDTGSELVYDVLISGDNNFLTVRGGAESSMSKTLVFDIDGDGNDVSYDGEGALTAEFFGFFIGDSILADIRQQNGVNQSATVIVENEPGAAGLNFDVSQQGDNQRIFAIVSHRAGVGVGEFTITQDMLSPGAVYEGVTVLAAGGFGLVSQ